VSDDERWVERWVALRAPFPPDQTEWLPKQLRRDDKVKGQCERAHMGVCADDHPCGGYHARSIHLTYVGHAGITMRLNEVCTPAGWNWEPMALTPTGLPLFSDGGLWIKLTILGETKIGFGDAEGKTGPAATKEVIGDALRNGALRFGIGTYLWSKSEAAQVLKAGGDPDASPPEPTRQQQEETPIPPATVSASDRLLAAWQRAAVASLNVQPRRGEETQQDRIDWLRPQLLARGYADTVDGWLALADDYERDQRRDEPAPDRSSYV
jgi:hypothetical protein